MSNVLLTYSLFYIDFVEDGLLMFDMNSEWLMELLEEDPEGLAHAALSDGDRILLTASTEELREFWSIYLEDVIDAAYEEASIAMRL